MGALSLEHPADAEAEGEGGADAGAEAALRIDVGAEPDGERGRDLPPSFFGSAGLVGVPPPRSFVGSAPLHAATTATGATTTAAVRRSIHIH